MRRVLCAIFLILPLVLSGCFHAQLKGSVSGATVTVAPLRDPNSTLVASSTWDKDFIVELNGQDAWDSYDAFVRLALMGIFVLDTSGLDPDQLYLITASGGRDADQDSDLAYDDSPAVVSGSWHAIMTYEQLTTLGTKVTVLTEAAYQIIRDELHSLSDAEVLARLEEMAQLAVQDVDDSGSATYEDLLKWSVLFDKDKFLGQSWQLDSIATLVAENTSTADQLRETSYEAMGQELPVSTTTRFCAPEPFPPSSVEDDGYRQFELCGWSVYMNIELFDGALGDDVYDALGEDLIMILSVLPLPALNLLRNTNIWMELDGLPAFPGGVYHPSASWLQDNGYPTKWAGGVQFGNARNFLTWVKEQPAMLLHEFSHAWHYQKYGYVLSSVTAAYDSAMEAGLYDAVEYVYGQIQEAYATSNSHEYFAELSEAYFWRNDYYPFERADLEAHDPAGYVAVEEAWLLR